MKILKPLTIFSAVACISASSIAYAVPINGSISFNGDVVLNTPANTATAFDAFGPVSVSVGTQTGNYVGTGGTGGVVMTPFAFDPALSPSPVAPVWTFSAGPTTYSFDLLALTNVNRNNNGNGTHTLSVAGTGLAKITGFTDTVGSFSITTTGDTSETDLGFGAFTFVVAGNSVPDGGTSIILLGLSLLGLAGFRKKLSL